VRTEPVERPVPAESGRERGRASTGALAVIAATQLMLVLDVTIVNVALPSIRRALDFSAGALPWVVTAYTAAFGALLLLGGALGDRYGRRRLFVVSVGVFTAASAAAGLADDAGWLLGARVAQGAGAAFASACALALISTTFPEGPARTRAFGVYSAMSGAGLAVGLVAGGVLTQYASWRWVFLVNVPIGLFVMLLAPRTLVGAAPRETKLDVAGALLSGAALATLVYALSHASSAGWSDPATIGCLGAAAGLTAIFLLRQHRIPAPLAPVWLFKSRYRLGSYAVMLLLNAALFGLFYFLTQFFQDVLGYGPLEAGLAFLPSALGLLLGAAAATAFAQRTGVRAPAVLGTALTAAGLLWLALATARAGASYGAAVLAPMTLVSIGAGLTLVPGTMAASAAIAEEHSGAAAGVLNTARQIGASAGLAALSTVAADTSGLVHGAATLPTAAYHYGFLTAAGLAAAAAVVALLALPAAGAIEIGTAIA
jgi:EmrB/QacA subfamily drug resistance transporter